MKRVLTSIAMAIVLVGFVGVTGCGNDGAGDATGDSTNVDTNNMDLAPDPEDTMDNADLAPDSTDNNNMDTVGSNAGQERPDANDDTVGSNVDKR